MVITYSAEQTYTVLRLLDDYSKLVRAKIDELERYREEKITILAQIIVLITAIVLPFLIPGFMHSFIITPFIIAISSIWFHSTIVSLRFLFSGMPRAKNAKEEIKVLTTKLERLIRLAVQIAEHAEQDPGKRLELDFQLDIAEAVLHRAEKYR